ncbi:DUF2306 domain-containing protein [Yoonia sp.]|uniref:DUF2306 domain-containing protein n=1 Tax=Yoonia sp. TaxID=2212373 RepID=UPI003919A1ED
MTLGPLFEASFIIQLHVMAALPALVLGPLVLWGRGGRLRHKVLGYGWVVSMLLLAASGLFIPSGGPALAGHFGPIHLLCLLTFIGIWQGVGHARQRRIAAHQKAMRQIWFWALGLAGLFTLLPGRIMHEVLVAGGGTYAAWLAIVVGVSGLVFLQRRRPRPFRMPHSAG